MKSLLIIAHGSRKESSNDEVRSLANSVHSRLTFAIDSVAIAFLEFATPSIDTAVDNCFNAGTDDLIVLPYFLCGGNHVTVDVPRAIESALKRWPDKTITMLPHIGTMDMATLIAAACDNRLSLSSS